MSEPIDAPEELLGIPIEGNGTPPQTRLKNGASGRALLQKYITEDKDASDMRAVVDGQIGGNPPYNDKRRKLAGLNWTANLNMMGGKALMDSSAVPYYAIFNGVEHYAETRTLYQPNHPDHELWHGHMARRFHCMLRRWGDFDWNIQDASYHMRKHGIGPCFFEKEGDWRFRSIGSGKVLVPRHSPSRLAKRVKAVAIRIRYSVVELWEFIKDEESAKKLGWDVDAVKLAIKRAGQRMLGDNAQNWYNTSWETFQSALKNNDVSTSYTECDDVACAALLVQEFGGKVSHFVVTESEVVPLEPMEKKDDSFLFKHVNRYDSYDQALVVFFQDIGDSTWHSVRGMGDLSHKHIEILNRTICRTIDGAFIESSLVLQPTTTRSADKAQLVQWGAITMLPAGLEIKQTKLAGFLEGPMAVIRMVRNDMAQNIGMFQQRSISRDDGRGEVATAEEVRAQVQKESTLSQGQMSLFYQTLDMLYTEMFRRAADPNTSDEEAQRFQRECKEDGVPAKALQEMEYVRANRASGYGSPQMRQLTDQQMMPLVAMLPEDGKQHFLEDAVAGIKGADKVRRYVPREHVPKRDDADAAMENAMIAMGRAPVMISGQNHVIHLHSHLDDAANTLTPIREAMEAGRNDPAALQQAYAYLQLMGPHVEAHIGALRPDATRKQLAKYFEDQMENLVSFSGKLRRAIIQSQKEAQLAAEQESQATALSALDQARVDSIRRGADNEAFKTQKQAELRTYKTMSDIRLKQVQTAEEIRRNRALEENAPKTNGNGETHKESAKPAAKESAPANFTVILPKAGSKTIQLKKVKEGEWEGTAQEVEDEPPKK